MGNTIYVKFKDTDLRVFQAGCLSFLSSEKLLNSEFKYSLLYNDKIKNLPEYGEIKSDIITFSNVEYFEYRLVKTDITEKYGKLLLSSSFNKWIKKRENGEIYYQFTLNDPLIRIIYVVSVMRYLEEHNSILAEELDNPLIESPDAFLIFFSIKKMKYNGHGVFIPTNCMENILSKENWNKLSSLFETEKSILDYPCNNRTGYRFYESPSQIISRVFPHSEEYRKFLDKITPSYDNNLLKYIGYKDS